MRMRTGFTTAPGLAAGVVVLAVCVNACGGSPVAPPPVVTNTPPTIESLTAASLRAEAGRPLQVTAVVKDTESLLDQLTYTWSASPQTGTFSGTGPSVRWTPPVAATTPGVYTITLTVTESYSSGGQAKQNSVAKTTTVHYNDSDAEVKGLGYDFLVLKFGNYNVSAAEAVSNFSDIASCRQGKADEFDDVKDNREFVHIMSASFPSPRATFNEDLTSGSVEGTCTFEDIPGPGQDNAGKREFVSGTCLLTTVYESDQFRWRLCTSSFNGPYDTTLASLRGRVPGRPYTR
jgi:hypothetical protein